MNQSRNICAVTGLSGLVGSACGGHLASLGSTILPLKRSGLDPGSVRFELGQDIDCGLLRRASFLIHCAYDFSARSWDEIYRINVEGSIKLLEAAAKARVKKIIFISSVSAFEGCRSLYGKGKLLVETRALKLGGFVIRPGLVYGAGRGMYSALERISLLPVIPVFDRGEQPLVLVHVADLARAVGALVAADFPEGKRFLTAAHPNPLTFRDLMKAIAAKRGKKIKCVSIPSSLGLGALRLLEFLGLKPGFKSDSLVSLLHPDPDMDFTIPEGLNVEFRSFLD